jgi:hypothetical protein
MAQRGKIMRHVIWVTTALVAALVAVCSVLFAVYHEKIMPQPFVKAPYISGRLLGDVSDRSQVQLQKFLKDEEKIIGISVIQANLVKNRRTTVYFISDSPALQAAWDEYITKRQDPPALFKQDSPEMNTRVVDIFNGSFICVKFTETVSYAYWPKGAEAAPWICTVPVPPGFDGSGDFTGYINFFFSTKPTENDQRRISKAAAEISKDIYKRDVENSPVK